ncbi:MAG TPA: YezD family protein [Candidatus Binataceae bacterium]
MDKLSIEPDRKVDVQTIDPFLLERIAQAIGGLRFGSVEIVIQDGRVVQIERKEKFRLDVRKDGQVRVTA